jgi:ribosome-binding protein aMBF1 (putative translation factor)
MEVQRISLLEEKPMIAYNCQMCGETTRRNKFRWISWFGDSELTICRECAYKEKFGTRNSKQAKKERLLEKKEINQN